MANVVYTAGLLRLVQQGWSTQDVRALLLAEDVYVPDAGHSTLADLDLATSELDTTNYERKTLASLVEAAGAGVVSLDAGDVTWTLLGGASAVSVGAMVLYFHVDGTAANDVPFLYIDNADATDPGFRFPRVTSGGDFAVTWSAAGVAQLLQGS